MSNHSVSADFASSLRQDVALSTDALRSMMEAERTIYRCRDYLRREDDYDGECEGMVTPDDRTKIVDWCYDIVDRCHFERETVAVAMSIADRFAGSQAASSHGPQDNQDVLRDRSQYQLVVMASLYVSIKLSERAAFGSHHFAEASRGAYTVEDIEGMERRICNGLSWRLCPPTSLQATHQILSLMLHRLEDDATALERGAWEFLLDETSFQTESAVREYRFATQRPSTVAMAAIVNAVEQVGDSDYERLTAALLQILNEFDFDSSRVLLKTRDRLRRIANEHEGGDADSISSPTVVSTDTCDNRRICRGTYGTPISPSVVSLDTCNDSCLAVC